MTRLREKEGKMKRFERFPLFSSPSMFNIRATFRSLVSAAPVGAWPVKPRRGVSRVAKRAQDFRSLVFLPFRRNECGRRE